MTPTWLAKPLAGAALGAVLFAGPARAGDADVQQRIEQRLAKAGLDRRANVTVSVSDGVVQLTGIALSYADYMAAERAARKEAHAVVNQLRVVPEEARSDGSIQKDAAHEVLEWDRYGPFDAVSVDVRQGVALLEGWVETQSKKEELEERLARVPGVRDVHNDLRLQGFSQGDRLLRQQVFTRIYANPMFERWAGVHDPPVRVFVSRGRITLAGRVGSQVEKATAGNIARGTLSFSVSNQLQVEGEAGPKEDQKKAKSERS